MLILRFIAVLPKIQAGTACWADPEIYLPAIAAVCGLILVLVPSIRWCKRKYRARALFYVYYEPERSHRRNECAIRASGNIQRIPVTLVMNLETNVEFVSLKFEGEGQIPTIKSLDDWEREQEKKPANVVVDSTTDGKWYWHYSSPWHRLKKARITIGINCLAKDPCMGQLIVGLTTSSDGDKRKSLPFAVYE